MSEQLLPSCFMSENLQSKSNMAPKPNLPPKPKFRPYPKLKVAPRPGEAKQNLPNILKQDSASDFKHNISLNPSSTSSLTESLSLDQTSKSTNSNENITLQPFKERSANLNEILLDEKNQTNNNELHNHQSEKNISTVPNQLESKDSTNQNQNSLFHTNISTENNHNFDNSSHNGIDTSQLPQNFPQVSVPPPTFKQRQFKYMSGNLTGTSDFPEFDKKLNEMLRLYQAPRLNIKKNF